MIAHTDFLAGRKIYSNYDLTFPHVKYDIEDLLSIATMEMDISPKTVVMQEASKWFDARRSGRRENVLLSSFTGQSGKREIDIYYDDQFITRIDRGLRDITDFSFLSEVLRDNSKQPILFSYTMYGGYFAYPLNRTLKFLAKEIEGINFPSLEKYYDMYNTRQPTQALDPMKER